MHLSSPVEVSTYKISISGIDTRDKLKCILPLNQGLVNYSTKSIIESWVLVWRTKSTIQSII
jgi:hypothetical protein